MLPAALSPTRVSTTGGAAGFVVAFQEGSVGPVRDANRCSARVGMSAGRAEIFPNTATNGMPHPWHFHGWAAVPLVLVLGVETKADGVAQPRGFGCDE